MHVKYLIPTILALTIFLAACGSTPPPVATDLPADLLNTQVALLLTATHAASSPTSPAVQEPAQEPGQPAQATPTPLPTDTPEPATSTPPPPTETPTQVPTETPTPRPTSTPMANDPRKLLGNPTWRDATFKENQNWGEAWEDDYTSGRFSGDKMILTSVGVDGWTLTWPKPADFYVEMTAQTHECAGGDRYGLIVRVPDTYDRGYLVGFTCDGRYSLRKWNPEARRYEVLINWTESSHINAGSNQINRVGVKAQGSRFELYANGAFLAEASDAELKEGRFGPFIGHDRTENFTISISEIAYWKLD
jgi:hypothetical protein